MSFVGVPQFNGWEIEFESAATGETVMFRAAITSFNDSYQSNWQREDAYGRMDPIQAFKNTTRQINLGWQIAAASDGEAIQNLQKISQLIRMLYPSYDKIPGGSRVISGSPLVKVKFANLITNSGDGGGGLIGTLDGVEHNPVLEAGFCSNGGKLYPKIVDVQCTFHPLHVHSLGTDQDGGFGSAANFPYKSGPAKSQEGTDDGGTDNRLRAYNDTEIAAIERSLEEDEAALAELDRQEREETGDQLAEVASEAVLADPGAKMMAMIKKEKKDSPVSGPPKKAKIPGGGIAKSDIKMIAELKSQGMSDHDAKSLVYGWDE